MTNLPPRWDLSNIYTSLADPKLAADQALIGQLTATLTASFEHELLPLASPGASPEALSAALNQVADTLNHIFTLSGTLGAYLSGLVSTNSFDKAAAQALSAFHISLLPLRRLNIRLQKWLGSLGGRLDEALALPGSAADNAFYFREQAEQSRFMMSEAEEVLASELTLSGGTAWGELQGTLTSQKTVQFELDGQLQTLTMPALINLRNHPDPLVRERAFRLECQTWEGMKEPLAACLNGVKGEVGTLEARRGRADALESALDSARIDRPTLEAMLSAIEDSLPTFRAYFQAKARFSGKDQLAWWDLFAPLGSLEKTYTFDQAREIVLTQYASFSPEMAEFARGAFEKHWIDAEQRPGKRGGAFCMEIPGVQESRVLSNFDGSFEAVMTLAHELGHGFHNYCAFQAGKQPLQTQTPMTLAETASIMCENIVSNALLRSASSREEELALLESSISGDAQVTVDILSRFLFEREVFARRAKGTLPAEEICEIMLEAQRQSYGESLSELNPWAWTWKPHYYRPGLSFYNFPYAFGLLFGTGLYTIFEQRGQDFVPQYKALLASTGEAPAAELAARFGIDIRSKGFWQDSLAQIGRKIARYQSL